LKQTEEIKCASCWSFSHITKFYLVKNKFRTCLEPTVLRNNFVTFLTLTFSVEKKQTNTHTHTHTYTHIHTADALSAIVGYSTTCWGGGAVISVPLFSADLY
jgi:hypothetical protein